jgi:hypothetical protein
MNSLSVINAYKHGPMWVFDEPNYNLVKEPFVAGADTFLDYLAKGDEKISLVFSNRSFPTSDYTLHLQHEESGGGVYDEYTTTSTMWLCAATKHYFGGKMPKEIHVQYILERRKNDN